MDAAIPKLLFAGVVPAVCDAEAGQEHSSNDEGVIASRVERPQDPPSASMPPRLGAHVVTPRHTYLHHGIYVGNGQVVHYAGLVHRMRGGPIEVISVAAFTQGYPLWVIEDRVARFTPAEVVRRAMSRIGEDRYHLFKNNCEHFCEWCLRAEHRSYQVDRLLAAPRHMLESASKLAIFVLGAVGRRRQSRETMFVQERIRC